MAESYTMDDTDKALLNIIQSGFPIESRPYAVLGEKTGISEEEALERVRKMRKNRIIRRMGANFQSKKLVPAAPPPRRSRTTSWRSSTTSTAM